MEDLPSRWYYIALLSWLAVVVGLVFVADVRVATLALAGSMIVVALLRLVAGPRVVHHVRSTWFDVASLLIVAGILVYLSQWGLSPAF